MLPRQTQCENVLDHNELRRLSDYIKCRMLQDLRRPNLYAFTSVCVHSKKYARNVMLRKKPEPPGVDRLLPPAPPIVGLWAVLPRVHSRGTLRI